MIDVLKLQRSTRKYEFADGIRDFQSAFWLLVTGCYIWLFWDLPSIWMSTFADLAHTYGRLPAVLAACLFIIGLPVVVSHAGLKLVNEYVRRRWLWRNTGYITPKAWVVPRITIYSALALNIVLLVGGILVAIQLRDWQIIWRAIYLGTGLSFGYMYLLVGHQMRIGRYRPAALVGMVTTLVITFLPLTLGLAGLMVNTVWATILIISGVYALRQVAAMQEGLGLEDAS